MSYCKYCNNKIEWIKENDRWIPLDYITKLKHTCLKKNKIEINKIYNMDCIEGMKLIKDNSINMILCDLPYGITSRNKWDIIIPFNELWYQYKRIIKENGTIILTAVEPFSSKLICSNIDMFKYEWIWIKSRSVNFLNAKKQNLRKHEHILVFYKKQCTYNPQGLIYKPRINKRSTTGNNCNESGKSNFSKFTNYPTSILEIRSETKTVHPTQKPLKLFEYLIKTYTNENDLVLDNCIGSGTTAVACKNLNRNFIGFELNEKYFDIANERLKQVIT